MLICLKLTVPIYFCSHRISYYEKICFRYFKTSTSKWKTPTSFIFDKAKITNQWFNSNILCAYKSNIAAPWNEILTHAEFLGIIFIYFSNSGKLAARRFFVEDLNR